MKRAALILLVAACDAGEAAGDSEASMPVALVAPHEWSVVETDDLFAKFRPPEVECDPDRGMYVEETAWQTRFEINTAWCNYATVDQPLLEDLSSGDTVEVRVWHFDLTGTPAEAYLGVGLEGAVVWEERVPIPSEGALIKSTFTIDDTVAAGTPLQFHVHNHGNNTWELVSIERI